MPSRSLYRKSTLKTSSYWITISKNALTAKSETTVGSAGFDADDGNTKQHWLLLTAQEMETFDQFWTGIDAAPSDKGEMTNDGWYDLEGRKLSGKPDRRGVYIHNGKKTLR